MSESPALAEVKEVLRKRYEADGMRRSVVGALETRFGPVPAERLAALNAVTDEAQLQELLRLVITCSDADAFVAGLTEGK